MGKRRMYNTTLDTDLIKEIKILAAQLDKRQNDLLEEAIKDLLEKYRYQDEEESSLGISNG
jgi:predicted transcriptional regulator